MARRAPSWKRAVASALSSWPGIVAAVAASNGGLVEAVRRLSVALFVSLLRLRKTVMARTQGIVLGSVTSFAGKYVSQYVELLRWRRRVFYNRVHLVLLSWDPVAEPSARVEKRTLFEGSLEESILNGNHAAAKLCSSAAARCTAKRPFVTQHLPACERYQVLNSALNLISSLTPAGHIAEDIYPASTVGCWYVFGLTVDQYAAADRPETQETKIRLTLVKEQVLLWLCDPTHADAIDLAEEAFEASRNQRHLNRWRCLRSMANIYQKQEDWALEKRGNRVMHILRVHLSVPMPLREEPVSPLATETPATPRLSTARRKSLQAAFHAQASLRQDRDDRGSPGAAKSRNDRKAAGGQVPSAEPYTPPKEQQQGPEVDLGSKSPAMFSPWAAPHDAASRKVRRASSAPVVDPPFSSLGGNYEDEDDDNLSGTVVNLGDTGGYIPDF